jgi:predicted Zn-dependent protease
MQSYSAILIHPKVSGGRCAGDLLIQSSSVVFKSAELNYTIPNTNLHIYAGGAGNRFVFFKDKNQEEISVYTSDKSVLKNSFIASDPNFSQAISESKKTLNNLFIGSSILLVLFLVFIVCLFLAKDKMVKSLAKQVPVEWEQKVGDQLFSTISSDYSFVQNDSLKKVFLTIAEPLFSQVEKAGYKVDLYFVKDPTINAFALPGGKVIVQTGLIENATSWEEVMGVLGHELAHVTERHHVRGIINNVGIFVILSAVLGDVSALVGTFASMGGDLASLANSRSFENEADETSWDYLVDAKIDPNGLISFFEILQNETAADSTKKESIDLSFLSTHPNTQKRIDNLKEKEKKLNQTFTPLPDNFNSFKEAILKIQ